MISSTFSFPFKPLTSEEFMESLLRGTNAKTPLDDKVSKMLPDSKSLVWLKLISRLSKATTDLESKLIRFTTSGKLRWLVFKWKLIKQKKRKLRRMKR